MFVLVVIVIGICIGIVVQVRSRPAKVTNVWVGADAYTSPKELNPRQEEYSQEIVDPGVYVSQWRNGSITLEEAVGRIAEYMENRDQQE